MSEPAGSPKFPDTRWSLVLDSRGEADGARVALAELCRVYWFPLYAFARAQGNAPHDAEDLTQAFFVQLLTKEVIARADPAAGKLRSYLLACFRNFISMSWRNGQSLRRGGGVEFIAIDHAMAEPRYAALQASGDPAQLYDRQWALALLEIVLARMRAQHSRRGEEAQFDALATYLSASADPGDYLRTAELLGMTESGVRVAVFRLRKRYRQLLREQIIDTLGDPGEADAELAVLASALTG